MLEELYSILEIDSDATEKDIKRAYARKVAKHHPEEDPDGWKKIHDAYTTLLEINKTRNDYQKLADVYSKLGSVTSDNIINPVINNEPVENKNYPEEDSISENIELEILEDIENDIPDDIEKETSEDDISEPEIPEDTEDDILEPEIAEESSKEILDEEDLDDIEEEDFDFDDDLENLIEVIKEEKNTNFASSNGYDPNKEMIKMLSEIVTSDGEIRKIQIDRYLSLRQRPQFIQAMLYPPFVKQLENYLRYISYEPELIKYIEEDVQKVQKYIYDKNVPTEINFDSLLKAMESSTAYNNFVEDKSTTSQTRKKSYKFVADMWWKLFVAGIVILFLIFKTVSCVTEYNERNSERDKQNQEIGQQMIEQMKNAYFSEYSNDDSKISVYTTPLEDGKDEK